MKIRLWSALAAGALCVAASNVQGAETQTYPAGNGPAKTSAGLFNDWLRAQSQPATNWDIGGQFRARYEAKENAGSFPNLDFIRADVQNDNDYFLLRTKFHLGYSPASWVNFFGEGRDSRAWSDERRPSPDQDKFDLHQAFVLLGNPKQFPLSLKVGRQEMSYGDERFIGAVDWINTGRVFDAAKVRFENDTFWLDAFAGRVIVPYDDHFNVANDYDWFSGVYFSSKKIIPRQETQIFFLMRNVGNKSPNAIATGVGGPGARDIYTPGLRVKSVPGAFCGWDYGAEIAGQFGSVSSKAGRLDHEALAADAVIGYTWSRAFGSPRLGLEYTYASGDSNPSDNKNGTFDLLFGTNHKLYGLMDLFGLRNMHNPSVSFVIKPHKTLALRLDYLAFWLADTRDFLYPESGPARNANGYGRNPQFDSFIGSELDFVATWQPAKWSEFQFGYGHFFAGDYIRRSAESVPANRGAADANWVYVQAKLSF